LAFAETGKLSNINVEQPNKVTLTVSHRYAITWNRTLVKCVGRIACIRLAGALQGRSLELHLTLWRPAAFGDFRKKHRTWLSGNFSSQCYGPGQSVKRRCKSSSLRSKKVLGLGVWIFLWVTS